jgi:hypothetical protein
MSAAMNNHQALHFMPQQDSLIHDISDAIALGHYATISHITVKKEGRIEYQIDIANSTTKAIPAEGLLVMPEKGDTVLCTSVNKEIFVSQVLKRAQASSTLSIHSTRPIEWVAPIVRFKAIKEMELLSANLLTLSACDVVVGATRSLVQRAKNFMQNAKTFSLTSKGLMRLNGRQQLIVAEEDLRMDAKRINMG